MKKRKLLMTTSILILLAAMLSSCSKSEKNTLTVADQFGLAYAPLQIMKEKDFLREELDKQGLSSTEIIWKTMGNTTAMREAMISGDLDIGFVGIPPFLIGYDNAMDWKIIAGLSESPAALISLDESIQSLDDVDSKTRIILPQPGSIQHILLAMYSQSKYGDAKKFDNLLVAMSHPDGVSAISADKDNQLHFTTPPFMQKELDMDGGHTVLDAQTCFGGEFTFIVGICPQRVYDDRKAYEAFIAALERSMEFMDKNPEEARSILASAYEYSREDLNRYLSDPQMKFTSSVKGADRFIKFMYENGMIKNNIDEKDIFWENANE